ncbi:hypothetical protein GJ496_006421 [Pomphorhynchus laevis]|nr:hypothetical protein GJ496_006421 [Pomphorhynchus laevis]
MQCKSFANWLLLNLILQCMVQAFISNPCFYVQIMNTYLQGHNDAKRPWISAYNCYRECLNMIYPNRCKSFEHWPRANPPICVLSTKSRYTRPNSTRKSRYGVTYFEINCSKKIISINGYCSKDLLYIQITLNIKKIYNLQLSSEDNGFFMLPTLKLNDHKYIFNVNLKSHADLNITKNLRITWSIYDMQYFKWFRCNPLKEATQYSIKGYYGDKKKIDIVPESEVNINDIVYIEIYNSKGSMTKLSIDACWLETAYGTTRLPARPLIIANCPTDNSTLISPSPKGMKLAFPLYQFTKSSNTIVLKCLVGEVPKQKYLNLCGQSSVRSEQLQIGPIYVKTNGNLTNFIKILIII